jgi:hypothetical protein
LLKLRLDILVPSLNDRLCPWLRVGRALARNAVVLFRWLCFSHHLTLFGVEKGG